MTNHSYFNLAGEDAGAEAMLKIIWYRFMHGIYTCLEEIRKADVAQSAPVKGTPMDFTEPKTIGQDVEAEFDQLIFGGGYDHNYAFQRKR